MVSTLLISRKGGLNLQAKPIIGREGEGGQTEKMEQLGGNKNPIPHSPPSGPQQSLNKGGGGGNPLSKCAPERK